MPTCVCSPQKVRSTTARRPRSEHPSTPLGILGKWRSQHDTTTFSRKPGPNDDRDLRWKPQGNRGP
jgi:hypothetical protein